MQHVLEVESRTHGSACSYGDCFGEHAAGLDELGLEFRLEHFAEGGESYQVETVCLPPKFARSTLSVSNTLGGMQAMATGQERTLGLRGAVTLNLLDMIGVGPFITLPLLIGAMGGPQAMLGWVLGAVLAVCQGLVWAELGAAMPEAGGTNA